MAEAGRLCPKAGQAKRPGGVKKASVLMKDRDTKMYPIFLEDEGQTVHLHRSFSAVPLRLLLSGAAACAYGRSCFLVQEEQLSDLIILIRKEESHWHIQHLGQFAHGEQVGPMDAQLVPIDPRARHEGIDPCLNPQHFLRQASVEPGLLKPGSPPLIRL